MTKTEFARILGAVRIIRPDWPHESLVTRWWDRHQHRPALDFGVAAVWVALDPDTQTPARLDEPGPWWAATRTSVDKRPPIPPCPIHGYTARRPDGSYPCCDSEDPTPRPARVSSPPPRPLRDLVRVSRPARADLVCELSEEDRDE